MERVLLVADDRESAGRTLEDQVGIKAIAAGQGPAHKLELVHADTR
jgi:hypothetical protein